jgi:putative PIG3 family NAD(P)H quinone oxidoreductase
MKAIVISEFGGPEVLKLRDVELPVPQRGEVRVRVRATAVNRADLVQRLGAYAAPPGAPKDIPGLEYAGEVDAVGEGVTDVALGERVFGLVGGGAYAEAIVVHAREIVRMPADLSFTDAAALPEAALTAYDAMVTRGRLAAGETVLVSAVGSGVGTAAVQIARAIGARSIGTARTKDKLERARALGLAVGVVAENGAFRAGVLAAAPGGVDVVLELVGGAYVDEDLACLAPKGRIVVVGLMAGAQTALDLRTLLFKRAELHGTVLRSRPLEEKIAATKVFERHLVPLVSSGALKPVVDLVLPLEEAAKAHEVVGRNETFGKVILKV